MKLYPCLEQINRGGGAISPSGAGKRSRFVVHESSPCASRLFQLDASHLTQGPVAFAEELLKGLGRLGLEPEGTRALVLATPVARLLFCKGVGVEVWIETGVEQG